MVVRARSRAEPCGTRAETSFSLTSMQPTFPAPGLTCNHRALPGVHQHHVTGAGCPPRARPGSRQRNGQRETEKRFTAIQEVLSPLTRTLESKCFALLLPNQRANSLTHPPSGRWITEVQLMPFASHTQGEMKLKE